MEQLDLNKYKNIKNIQKLNLLIDSGWRNLIISLTDKIQFIAERDDCIVIIDDIKEKFGGLRYYISGGNDEIDELIWKAEEVSYDICYKCGGTDSIIYTKGWILTLCKACFNENKQSIKNERSKKNIDLLKRFDII